VGDTLREAVQRAYDKAGEVYFPNGYYRSDIGVRALLALEGKTAE
jgi:phosphoribosylamine-glycine ligase